jgi:hypothetical protein
MGSSLIVHDLCHTLISGPPGEQSVGKSFALNHLADTSFAGSAMRTTGMCYANWLFFTLTPLSSEGVWMSVTPTEEALIVALDFEGPYKLPFH